jgi:2-methylisocitrate lyase-like PEP mutase family enzyme
VTADRLRALHQPGNPVVLPNAWDAASALAVERAGFPAVATSSAAVAEALGYADHEQAPVAEMFDAVRRITRVVSVPVTVDAEGGYGLSGAELAERLADAGAVGCNFEDTDHVRGGIVDVSRQADRVAELRAAAPDLVINARVDVFLYAPDQKSVLDDGIERARAYRAAGADCVYPIMAGSTDVLTAFVAEAGSVSVNLLPTGPTVADLTAAGLARISLATGLWRLTQRFTRHTLRALAAGISPYED